ncbi:substrate-binding domain-containing protein [bacterium]|nr:substrate-binding domain-containing protein [bacterium]
MRKAVLTVIVLVIIVGLIGIGIWYSRSGKKVKPLVGVSLLTKQHVFYRDLEKGMREEAAKRGLDLHIESAEFDNAQQTTQVENFITEGVDAIIVCPADSEGIVQAIKSANEKGVPVFTADITAKGGDVVCHVASNNVQGGRLAGEYLAKLLNGKGNIVIIDHPVVTSVQERVKGFLEAIKKYPGIKLVARQSGEGQKDKAMAVMENLLQAYPNINGVFGINDDSALGALAAIRGSKVPNKDKIVIVGYDATPEACKAILNDTNLKADVIQYPKKIGQKVVEVVAKYLEAKRNGKKIDIPKIIYIDVGIVDKSQPELLKELAGEG